MFKKTTKRALLASVLALVLCVSMLVGTTFAWFTDSVTSSNNVIKSGNLDIVLEYWNGAEWKDVENAEDILTGNLWEPGYVDVAYLRLKNNGSLALKYMLGINIVSETAGVNVAGESFKLSDYIYFDVIEGVDGETNPYTRDTAMAVTTEDTIISEGYTNAAVLNAGSGYVYLAMIVYMPTTVGNVANHNGVNAPQIDLGINVFATQATVESDAFDNQYDDLAIVETPAALAEAVAAGKDVVLNADINLNNTMARTAGLNPVRVPAGKSAIIDLNGHNITAVSTLDSGNQYAFQVQGDLTVVGEGTISIKHEGANMGWGALVAAFSVEGGSLTLGNGVSVINQGGSDMAYAVDVNTTLGATTLNVDGAFLYSSYIGVRIFNNHGTEKGTVNYNSGIIYGAKNGYDIWAQLMSAPAENAVVNIADGINYTTTATSGTIYYIADEVAYVADATALKNALTAGGNIVLLADIAVPNNETITVANGTTATIDLNGYKISSTADKTGNQELFLVKGNLTVKNGSMSYTAFNNQGWGAMITIFDVTAGGALTMDKVTASVGGSDMNFIVHLNNWGTVDLTVTDCDFTASYVAIRAFNSGNDMNTVVVKNTAFHGGRVFWVHNYTYEGKDASTLNVSIYGNGNTTDNAKPVRYGFDNEIYFNMDGVQLVTATTLAEVMAAAKNGNVIIDAQGANLGDFNYDGTFGDGTVLKNATFTYVYGASVNGVATFENCKFVSDHSYSANFSDGSYTGKVIFNNCYFDGWNSFGDTITNVEMNGCTFDWNNPCSMLRFYQNAQLKDCVFVDIDGIDTNKAGTVVELNNCTGIEGKIYNNTEGGVVKVGTWIVDGVELTDVPAW